MGTTSITDKPITNNNDNLLGIGGYAKALSAFILDSATPLTIGMQGEWGTGKTSLMFLVKEFLDEGSVATSWVNTWEYSMFKEPKETTPAVLKGLLENLVKTCKEKNYWGTDQKVSDINKKVTDGLKIIGKFAAQVAVKKATGNDIDFATSKSLMSEIAELKQEIQEIINLIIKDEKNPLKKVVFFVDDLDRIDPPVAVEILEALKNIFDIDNCVFILAIDYDVVIKGLENKFGKKTDQNEREFRSFFDKIIQVPFSMPLGAYDIDNLLKTKLESLGLTIKSAQERNYVQSVKLTVGSNPRSIKRYVNSFSLLKKIRTISETDNEGELFDFCLFALLGIQISYPLIFRLISKSYDFRSWNRVFANTLGVDDISVPDESHEFTNEEWEQVCWAYCQKDPYLKARALNILEVLNLIRDRLGNDFIDIMEGSMEFASMTSVDDDVEAKQSSSSGKRTTFDGFDGYMNMLKSDTALCERTPPAFFALIEEIHKDLRDMFKDKEDVIFLYTQTGGISLYAKGKKTGTKFLGVIPIIQKKKSWLYLPLLLSPRNQYQLPEIPGLDIKKDRWIDWFSVDIADPLLYSAHKDKIKKLIADSFEVRDLQLQTLKPEMDEARQYTK